MNDRESQEQFNALNARYFGGSLPSHSVRLVETIAGERASVSGRIENGVIYLQRTEDSVRFTSALLHEMAHAAVGLDHDRAFYDELERLIRAGAALVGDDDVSEMTYEEFEAREILKEAIRRGIAEESATRDRDRGGL